MIKIAYPWWNQLARAWDGPINAYIVPDLAPHLSGTWVVYRHEDMGIAAPNWWQCGNLETGCSIRAIGYGRESCIKRARAVLAEKTEAEYQHRLRVLAKKIGRENLLGVAP